MGAKGFKLKNGDIVKYDYPSLDNITTDKTLTQSGVAADAKSVGDEFNQIGTRIKSEHLTDWSTATIDHATWTAIDNITLTPGMWIITYGARIATSDGSTFSNGTYTLNFSTSNTSSTNSPTRMTKNGLLSGYSYLTLEGTSTCQTNGSTYYMYAYQTSGSTANILPYIEAVRIKGS